MDIIMYCSVNISQFGSIYSLLMEINPLIYKIRENIFSTVTRKTRIDCPQNNVC